MTRIQLNLSQATRLDAQDVQRLAQVGTNLGSPRMALMLTGPKSHVDTEKAAAGPYARTVEGTVGLARDAWHMRSSERVAARQALRELASQLTDAQTGKVHSGFMRLSRDGLSLENSSRWVGGNRKGAVSQVRIWVQQAYGKQLSQRGMENDLNQVIERYLATSNGKLGTQSLVGLVRTLEHTLFQDDAFLAHAQVAGARLQTQNWRSSAWPADKTLAWQQLSHACSPEDKDLQQALDTERARILLDYPWVDGTTLGKQLEKPDQDHYRIVDFPKAKLMERLASERGMSAETFFKLVQHRGSDQFIDPAGASHPDSKVQGFHQALGVAFQEAKSLDDFYQRLVDLAIKLSSSDLSP